MKILVQRVNNAKVLVNKEVVGDINNGLLLFVGFTEGDNIEKIDYLINKVLNLRVFEDKDNIMNLNILDIKGEILSISQFTLYANTKKGHRPSYTEALNSKEANILYNEFNNRLSKFIKVETGIFGSDMEVILNNNGPITIMLEK